MNKYLLPLGAAAAVLSLMLGVWWLAGPSSSGGDAAPMPAPGDAGTAAPGGGSDPNPGSTDPWDIGSAEPVPHPGSPNEDPLPKSSDPLAVPITSYRVDDDAGADGRRLAIEYTIGVPECYGTIKEPTVHETADSVVVTLRRIPPRDNANEECIDIALVQSVDITLDAPLDGRHVLDGSYTQPVVVPVGAGAGAPGEQGLPD